MPSRIPWTDETWNPTTGCNNDIISAGCTHCYARRVAQHRLKGRFGYPVDDPFRVTVHRDNLDRPTHWRKPRRVFLCSMGDLFHDDVPFGVIHEIWDVMKACPDHTFCILTKRPERMRRVVERIYSLERMGASMGFWSHVWLGVTAENQRCADERIPILLRTPAAVRFVSIEPMLSEIDAGKHLQSGLDWCIIGCESGPKSREMKEEWVKSLVRQCESAKVAVFYKQAKVEGKVHSLPKLDGKSYCQYPQSK